MAATSALALYRQILRQGKRLKLSDYQYLHLLVRRDFVRFGSARDPKEVDFQLAVRPTCKHTQNIHSVAVQKKHLLISNQLSLQKSRAFLKSSLGGLL